MSKVLYGIAWLGLVLLAAGSAPVMAQTPAVTTSVDVPVADAVVIPLVTTSGDTVFETVPLSGEVSLVTVVVPPNPIRVSAMVSLSGVGDISATCYLAQGSSTIRPVDPYLPQDPYRVLFTTRLIALHPGDPYLPSDPYAPAAPCDEEALRSQAIPQAAVIYPLTIAATLEFDEAGLLITATIDDLSVSGSP